MSESLQSADRPRAASDRIRARPKIALGPLTRREHELGDKVEVVRCEVTAARVMNPPQGLRTTADQPEIDVESDVGSSRFMAIAQLSQRRWSHLLVEDCWNAAAPGGPCSTAGPRPGISSSGSRAGPDLVTGIGFRNRTAMAA